MKTEPKIQTPPLDAKLHPYREEIDALFAEHQGKLAGDMMRQNARLTRVPAEDIAAAVGVFLVVPDAFPFAAAVSARLDGLALSLDAQIHAHGAAGATVYLLSRPAMRVAFEDVDVFPHGAYLATVAAFKAQGFQTPFPPGYILGVLLEGAEILVGALSVRRRRPMGQA